MPRTAWLGLPPGPRGKEITDPRGASLHQCLLYDSHTARSRGPSVGSVVSAGSAGGLLCTCPWTPTTQFRLQAALTAGCL